MNYPEINAAIQFRDYEWHHYVRLIHEIVPSFTQIDLPKLEDCLLNLINKNSPG
jgi:uncharacterized protein with HEPN domain